MVYVLTVHDPMPAARKLSEGNCEDSEVMTGVISSSDEGLTSLLRCCLNTTARIKQ